MPPGSRLRRGALRWGLMPIGAFAFVDTFALWWSARGDPERIPFGEIEGVGLSDPSRLTDWYGWTVPQLVSRYVAVGWICWVLLALRYASAAWRPWRKFGMRPEL